MKKEAHTSTTQHEDHGTMTSYVIGFILSINFTIIPYYLVVNKVITGNALLVTILGFAVLQMLVQIFFFLHLGRGPKPMYNVAFFFGTVGIIIVTVGASLFIMSNLYNNMTPEETTLMLAQKEGIAQVGDVSTGACQGNKNNHVFIFSGGKISPGNVFAERCDTLTFINKDPQKREIAFGEHPNDVSYGGEYSIVLDDDRPETITLNEVGPFILHDHLDSNIRAYFVVYDE